MSKIKVLKHNQTYMAWLGIYPYHLTEPTMESHKHILAYHNLIFPIFSIVSSAVFVYENPSELQAVLETILVMIALYQAECTFLNTALQMKNIKLLHLKLQAVVDQGKFFGIYCTRRMDVSSAFPKRFSCTFQRVFMKYIFYDFYFVKNVPEFFSENKLQKQNKKLLNFHTTQTHSNFRSKRQ